MMNPPEIKIVHSTGFNLVGKRLMMSWMNNRNAELFRQFMPHRNSILHRIDDKVFSVQCYSGSIETYFQHPEMEFEKWAAVAVTDLSAVPQEMEVLQIPAGEYLTFIYRGTVMDYPATARFVFGEWIPASEFVVDDRPHFEIIPEGYRPDDPNAEEEVWIPVKRKS
jgi:AraC family transcriptional regulator